MTVHLLCFGITKDIIGKFEYAFEAANEQLSVGQLREALVHQFTDFSKLKSLQIAVNSAYADDDTIILPSDEVVLIPPVSGG